MLLGNFFVTGTIDDNSVFNDVWSSGLISLSDIILLYPGETYTANLNISPDVSLDDGSLNGNESIKLFVQGAASPLGGFDNNGVNYSLQFTDVGGEPLLVNPVTGTVSWNLDGSVNVDRDIDLINGGKVAIGGIQLTLTNVHPTNVWAFSGLSVGLDANGAVNNSYNFHEGIDILGAAPWPLEPTNNVHQIQNAYGQFNEAGGIHLHEGIDLPTAADPKVFAIAAGKLVEFQNNPDDPRYNFITIADKVNSHNGWTYGHVIPKAGLDFTKDIGIGEEIGTVSWDHLHLQRTNDKNGGWHKNGNPLPHLADDPLLLLNPATDGTVPTIEPGFKYRRAADEGENASPKYFTDKDHDNVPVIGSRAKDGESGDIDVIVSAFDQFGSFADKLSIQDITFHSLGRLGDNTPFTRQLIDFSGEFLDDADNYSQFNNPAYAETLYENDKVADSKDYGPFWYIVTNQNNDNPVNKLETTDANWFWDTDGTKGKPWNDNQPERAANNAKSAFRDDFYDIYINVRDEAKNVGYKVEKSLLDNWLQTVAADKDLYFEGESVSVNSGEQHQQNDLNLPIYIVKKQPIAGAAISALDVIAGPIITTTDVDGIVQKKEVWKDAKVGTFFLLSDYDHDGIYHPRLDAFDPFRVSKKLGEVELRAGVQGKGDYEVAIGPNGAQADLTGQMEIDWTKGPLSWNLGWDKNLGKATFSAAGQTISFTNADNINKDFNVFKLVASAKVNDNVPAGSSVNLTINTINGSSVDYSIGAVAPGFQESVSNIFSPAIEVMAGTAAISGGTLKGRSSLDLKLKLYDPPVTDSDPLTGQNTIAGTSENDMITGTSSDDLITGGQGRDRFVFRAPNQGADTITDFTVAEDTLAVSAAGFGGGLTQGLLSESQFTLGATATTENHRFIYNSSDGILGFDQDGTGAIAPKTIAALSPNLNLSYQQFVIIA